MNFLSLKTVLLFLAIPVLVDCTLQTKFVAKFIPAEGTKITDLSELVSKVENPIAVKSCFTRTGYPYYWDIKTDTLVKRAIQRNSSAVGIADAEFVSEVFILGIFNRVCLEVRGQPVYAKAETITPAAE